MYCFLSLDFIFFMFLSLFFSLVCLCYTKIIKGVELYRETHNVAQCLSTACLETHPPKRQIFKDCQTISRDQRL